MNLPGAYRRNLPTLFFLILASAFHCFIVSEVFAQTGDGGSALRGRVTDTTGAALTGASVTLSNLTTGLERVVITDSIGDFIFVAPRSGRYRLTVSAAGFASASREVESDSLAFLNFALEPAALTDKITVIFIARNWAARSASECALRGRRSGGEEQ